ncbi:MAG: hypothetical protein NTX79_04920 [Candidatus Micrarchaeota archaeon]|nr:hypothetical protein [Candidatus Micrarchaeota archaeon]
MGTKAKYHCNGCGNDFDQLKTAIKNGEWSKIGNVALRALPSAIWSCNLTILVIVVLVASTIFQMAPACSPAFTLLSPFNIRYEMQGDGLFQNYWFFALLVVVYEQLCNIGKWKNKFLVFALAVLASYATSAFSCHYFNTVGAGSSILAFSMAIMLMIWLLGIIPTVKGWAKLAFFASAIFLVIIFTYSFLMGSSAREHALGGAYFLSFVYLALLLGHEIPFMKKKLDSGISQDKKNENMTLEKMWSRLLNRDENALDIENILEQGINLKHFKKLMMLMHHGFPNTMFAEGQINAVVITKDVRQRLIDDGYLIREKHDSNTYTYTIGPKGLELVSSWIAENNSKRQVGLSYVVLIFAFVQIVFVFIQISYGPKIDLTIYIGAVLALFLAIILYVGIAFNMLLER